MPRTKTVAKKKVVKRVQTSKAPCSISLKIGDETFTSTGQTALEALERLPNLPVYKITTKGFLTYKQDGKTTEQMYMPAQMKRFLYPIARIYMAKRLETLLK